ncbi:MAG: hypothetical protein KY468_01835 [Armatimonadetes bacterium]|nr:hypothetical protein [Armatimonadota bacterium]
MELRGLSSRELSDHLESRIRIYSTLDESHQEQILQSVHEMIARDMPPAFILSSARSLARQFAEEEEEAEQPTDSERQRFIEENALPPDERVSSRRQPRSEAKAREREQFTANVRQLLREARAAKQPHERKKLRRMLLGIDRQKLRRVLGREGQDLSDQIQEILLQSTDLR